MVSAIHPREATNAFVDTKLRIPNQPGDKIGVMFCNPNPMRTDRKLRTIARPVRSMPMNWNATKSRVATWQAIKVNRIYNSHV